MGFKRFRGKGPRGAWRLLAVALIAVTLNFAQEFTTDQSSLPTAREIESVMRGLSAITGFQIRKQLPFQMVTRDEVNKYLKDQIHRSVKPEELRAEEATLKKFGFVPPDFDLQKNTIDLLTEQAAAFYDFRRKKLFISDWATKNMRETALVHELAHALADQNFPIQKYLSGSSDDSEQSLARESVVEGQASWLMIEYAVRQAGKTLKDPATADEYLKEQPDSGEDSAWPVFSKAPLYIRRTLMFPYEDGQKFQQAIYLKEGSAAFARVFNQPPSSTAQIIHPERYFAKVMSTSPPLPKPIRHSKAFVTGSVGELDQRILLEQYLDTGSASSLAPKLKGGTYRIDEAKRDRRQMLLYISEWEDAASAGQYFDAYQRILRGKWKHMEITSQDATQFSGKCEDGYFSVTLKGTTVLSEEGFAAPVISGSGV
ncbi:MAG: hypothetical protein ABUS51_00140 [Acidobacteriota bacterium]